MRVAVSMGILGLLFLRVSVETSQRLRRSERSFHATGDALIGELSARQLKISLRHDADKLLEFDFRLPADLALELGRVADEEFHLAWALVAGVVLDVLLPVEIEQAEALLAEGADSVRFSGGTDIVVCLLLLEHQPHDLDILFGVAPVALGIEVAEVEFVLEAHLDAGGGTGDLAGHEGLSAAGALVIEEDAVGSMQVVGLPVIHGQPVGEDLGAAVGGAWVEWSGLTLGHLMNLSKHFGGGGLVEPYILGQSRLTDCLEEADRAQSSHVARVFGNIEGDAHVTLGSEVVDFIGAKFVEEFRDLGGVSQVTVVKEEASAEYMRVVVEVVDPLGIERGGAADDAVNLIALGEEEFCQVGPILPGDAGDQCFFHAIILAGAERLSLRKSANII